MAIAAAPFAGSKAPEQFLFGDKAFPELMARLLKWAAGGKP